MDFVKRNPFVLKICKNIYCIKAKNINLVDCLVKKPIDMDEYVNNSSHFESMYMLNQYIPKLTQFKL